MDKQNQDKILAFLNNKSDAKVEDICMGTKLSFMTVKSELKRLIADEKVNEQINGNLSSYNLTDNGIKLAQQNELAKKSSVKTEKTEAKSHVKTETKVAKSPAIPADKKKASKDEDLGPKLNSGRDKTLYSFGQHNRLSKGRIALLLVRTYAEKNPKVSLTKLQEIFHSSELFPRFQLVDEVAKAKKFSQGSRHRFFLAPQDIFLVGPDKKKCAVCSQFTKTIVDKLLKIVAAQPIGFKVKAEVSE